MREARIARPHIAHGAFASEVETFELPDVVQHTGVTQYHWPGASVVTSRAP